MLGAHLEIMVEEDKLCLAEVPMELMEELEDREALEAVEVMGALMAIIMVANQQEMEAAVEREVMGAVAEGEQGEGMLEIAKQEQEVQEVLAVLEEEGEVEEGLDSFLAVEY